MALSKQVSEFSTLRQEYEALVLAIRTDVTAAV